MHTETLSEGSEEPPAPSNFETLKRFRPAGRGFWSDVPDSDWNDWRWQLKHRISNVEQLQRLMPTLTPEEYAGAKLANHKLALGITLCFFGRELAILFRAKTNTARTRPRLGATV